MTAASAHTLRAPVAGDAEAVLAVIVACDIADLGVPDFELDDVVEEWDELDPARDAWVAEAGGTVVAYASARDGNAGVYVHPNACGRGIGTELLARVEARERERGARRHQQFVAERNVAARSLLAAHGYTQTYSDWRLTRSLAEPLPEPGWPVGLLPRAFEPASDAEAVHALVQKAFAEIPGTRSQDLDAWLVAVDPSRAIVACDARSGVIFGAVLSRRWEGGIGYVRQLAVDPVRRGEGLGRALLLAALHAFIAEGLPTAALSVNGANASAIRLYESVGMQPAWRVDCWAREEPGA